MVNPHDDLEPLETLGAGQPIDASTLAVSTGRCVAHSRSGDRCKNRPIVGANVCRAHGGSAPQVKAAAARRAAEAEARKAVGLWGGRRDVHPAEALLEVVQWKAAEVEHWRGVVERLGPWTSAKPPAAYQMLRQAELDLTACASASVRAGVNQALVGLAQVQAVRILTVLRNAAAALGMNLSDGEIASAIRMELGQ